MPAAPPREDDPSTTVTAKRRSTVPMNCPSRWWLTRTWMPAREPAASGKRRTITQRMGISGRRSCQNAATTGARVAWRTRCSAPSRCQRVVRRAKARYRPSNRASSVWAAGCRSSRIIVRRAVAWGRGWGKVGAAGWGPGMGEGRCRCFLRCARVCQSVLLPRGVNRCRLPWSRAPARSQWPPSQRVREAWHVIAHAGAPVAMKHLAGGW